MNYTLESVITIVFIVAIIGYWIFHMMSRKQQATTMAAGPLLDLAQKNGWTLEQGGTKLLDEAQRSRLPMYTPWTKNWFGRTGEKTYIVASKVVNDATWTLLMYDHAEGANIEGSGPKHFFALDIARQGLPRLEGRIILIPSATIHSFSPKTLHATPTGQQFTTLDTKLTVTNNLVREKDYVKMSAYLTYGSSLSEMISQALEEFSALMSQVTL